MEGGKVQAWYGRALELIHVCSFFIVGPECMTYWEQYGSSFLCFPFSCRQVIWLCSRDNWRALLSCQWYSTNLSFLYLRFCCMMWAAQQQTRRRLISPHFNAVDLLILVEMSAAASGRVLEGHGRQWKAFVLPHVSFYRSPGFLNPQ